MQYQVVPLTEEHLRQLLADQPPSQHMEESCQAYLSPGSVALCLLEYGKPVFAGGIVSMHWNRGEAWISPNPFFRSHLRLCLRILREQMPKLASEWNFRRIQATCINATSARLFHAMGFEYEGNLKKFGPEGENCQIWARIFEVNA